MNAYIGRQPIFDRYNRIAGYELLYRDLHNQDAAKIGDEDKATRTVLSDTVTVWGMRTLTNGLPAYINFTRNLIMTDFIRQANPEEVIPMIKEDTQIDETLLEKIRDLRKDGYKFALQGYAGQPKFRTITGLCHVICVDFSRVNSIQRRDIARNFAGPGVELLACKVESFADFTAAKNSGYSLFQGYYFEKPKCLISELPPLSESTYGRLIAELMKPEPNMRACRAMIMSDIVLSYMILRQAQNLSGRGRAISNLQQALMITRGEDLWRWVFVVLLQQTNITNSDELPKKAYIRGLFIERLAKRSALKFNSRDGFILGIFSLLDQVMGITMETLLDGFHDFEPDMCTALCDKDDLLYDEDSDNPYALFLKFTMIYEMANERIPLPEIHTSMTETEMYNVYMNCVQETDNLFGQPTG